MNWHIRLLAAKATVQRMLPALLGGSGSFPNVRYAISDPTSPQIVLARICEPLLSGAGPLGLKVNPQGIAETLSLGVPVDQKDAQWVYRRILKYLRCGRHGCLQTICISGLDFRVHVFRDCIELTRVTDTSDV